MTGKSLKLSAILSISVLAGAVLLSATACTPEKVEEKPDRSVTVPVPAPALPAPSISADAKPTATAAPSQTAVPAPTAPATEIAEEAGAITRAKIIQTVTGYYDFVSSPESLVNIKQTGSKFYGNPEITDADRAKITADFSEAFQYFEASSSENFNNAFNQLLANATQSSRTPGLEEVTVPADAITFQGGKATVKASKVVVTVNSKTTPLTGAPYYAFDPINLVEKADGSWVIVPEAPRQAIP